MSTSGAQTERAHETPFVRQFNVFLPNRVGRLSELLEILTEDEVEVAGLSVIDSTDWVVIRMIFTDVGRARAKLLAARVAFTESDALAVVLDEIRTFGRVCKALLAAELNIQFAYPLLVRHDDCPVLVFHTDDHVLTTHVLIKHGFTLLDHEDM